MAKLWIPTAYNAVPAVSYSNYSSSLKKFFFIISVTPFQGSS